MLIYHSGILLKQEPKHLSFDKQHIPFIINKQKGGQTLVSVHIVSQTIYIPDYFPMKNLNKRLKTSNNAALIYYLSNNMAYLFNRK